MTTSLLLRIIQVRLFDSISDSETIALNCDVLVLSATANYSTDLAAVNSLVQEHKAVSSKYS
jgi:hypothetical protein